jgi:regulator of replication initiation timing
MVHGKKQISKPEIQEAVPADWKEVDRTSVQSVLLECGPFQGVERPPICSQLKNRDGSHLTPSRCQSMPTDIKTVRSGQNPANTNTIQSMTAELEASKIETKKLLEQLQSMTDQLGATRAENDTLKVQLRSIDERLGSNKKECKEHREYSKSLKEKAKQAFTDFYHLFRTVLPDALPQDITAITHDTSTSGFLEAVHSTCIDLRVQLKQLVEDTNSLKVLHAAALQQIEDLKAENLNFKSEILNFKAEKRSQRHTSSERVHFSWSGAGKLGPFPR